MILKTFLRDFSRYLSLCLSVLGGGIYRALTLLTAPLVGKEMLDRLESFSGLPFNISKWISANPTPISMCFTKAEIRRVMILGVAVEVATRNIQKCFWHLNRAL